MQSRTPFVVRVSASFFVVRVSAFLKPDCHAVQDGSQVPGEWGASVGRPAQAAGRAVLPHALRTRYMEGTMNRGKWGGEQLRSGGPP